MDYKEKASEYLKTANTILETLINTSEQSYGCVIHDIREETDVLRKKMKNNEEDHLTFNSVIVKLPTTYNGPRYQSQWIEKFKEVVWELEFITKH